jgi:hypothetical protein
LIQPCRDEQKETESGMFLKDRDSGGRRVEAKRKIRDVKRWETLYFWGRRKNAIFLEGSQTLPARPSDKYKIRAVFAS